MKHKQVKFKTKLNPINSPRGVRRVIRQFTPTESEYEQELILQCTSAEGANLGKSLHSLEE